MSQGYKLVKRRSKPGDKQSAKKYYAVTKSNGVSDLTYLCKLISARSTVSSADVKAVLDSFNYVLDLELQQGRIVQLGEFGNFRLSVGSEGADTEEEFDSSMLRSPKIVFTPGAYLQESKKTTEFSKLPGEKSSTEGGNTPAEGEGGDDVLN